MFCAQYDHLPHRLVFHSRVKVDGVIVVRYIWGFIEMTSLGHLASLGVPFLWSTCLNNSYVRSIQWIYTLELEEKSSVTVTFALFGNAQLTFSPVKYPYCVLRPLLSSIQYPNIEEIYVNVLVLFIWSVLSLTNYVAILLNDRNFNIQSNNRP